MNLWLRINVSIHFKLSEYKKNNKQPCKQITNQDIKEIITAMTTSLIKIVIIIIK